MAKKLVMCQSRTSRFKEPALLSERWEPAHVHPRAFLFFFIYNFSLLEKYLRALRVLDTGITCMLCSQSCED